MCWPLQAEQQNYLKVILFCTTGERFFSEEINRLLLCRLQVFSFMLSKPHILRQATHCGFSSLPTAGLVKSRARYASSYPLVFVSIDVMFGVDSSAALNVPGSAVTNCPCFAGSFEPCLVHSASQRPPLLYLRATLWKALAWGVHVKWCDCQERRFLSSTLHCNEMINVIHLRYDRMIFLYPRFSRVAFQSLPLCGFQSFLCFYIPFPHLSLPTCVSVYSLCSPSCLCQFALCLSVFSCDATMCFTPASSPVSLSVFLWYVSFLLFLEC